MGKQSNPKLATDARHFEDLVWTFTMALAWVTSRTIESVEAAAHGYGSIDRRAVERLLRELQTGRITAWANADGKAFAFSPHRWRELEPNFTRVLILPGFLEGPGRLIVTVRDGTEKDIRDVTISSEAMRRIFPADEPAIVAPDRGRTKPQQERALRGLRGYFGDNVPTVAEMNNKTLCQQVVRWLAENKPLPKGTPEISNDSILRAAGRKKVRQQRQ